jgi:hypothetical protein
MDTLSFFLENWLLCLDLLCGLIWLLWELLPLRRFRYNWARLTNPMIADFGGWTPLVGFLFGFIFLGLKIVQWIKSRKQPNG